MPLEVPSDGSRQRPDGSFDEFSPYPPIADYAFMSDCEVTALVAPSGSVEWMCLPTMDGPSIFGAMLDRDAGWFRFGPDDVTVPSDRRNFPQAFTHLALINAVMHEIRTEQAAQRLAMGREVPENPA